MDSYEKIVRLLELIPDLSDELLWSIEASNEWETQFKTLILELEPLQDEKRMFVQSELANARRKLHRYVQDDIDKGRIGSVYGDEAKARIKMIDYVLSQIGWNNPVIDECVDDKECIPPCDLSSVPCPSEQVIKGVMGLAKYLGVSKPTAQKIINTHFLQDMKVAWQTGNGWEISIKKLEELRKDDADCLSINRLTQYVNSKQKKCYKK